MLSWWQRASNPSLSSSCPRENVLAIHSLIRTRNDVYMGNICHEYKTRASVLLDECSSLTSSDKVSTCHPAESWDLRAWDVYNKRTVQSCDVWSAVGCHDAPHWISYNDDGALGKINKAHTAPTGSVNTAFWSNRVTPPVQCMVVLLFRIPSRWRWDRAQQV